jgi:ribonuclease Z
LAEDIAEGVVYENNNVKVTAFEVDHTPVQPAFGYRVDYAGRSVVISGDTRFNENLIRYAQGTDVLLHEVAVPDLMRAPGNPEIMNRVIAHHTTPAQAGEVFSKVQPRLAVFTHILPTNALAKDMLPAVSKTYSGRVEAGEDLMVINVGDEVTVQRRTG